MSSKPPIPPIVAASAPAKTGTNYPSIFRSYVEGRTKQALGDIYGLSNFGVNRTTLPPGSASALLHHHSKQDEFVYILEGTALLEIQGDDTPQQLDPGMCVGFPSGQALGHRITNASSTEPVVMLEIGDRSPDDQVEYPHNDLRAVAQNGKWVFTHKDRTPCDE